MKIFVLFVAVLVFMIIKGTMTQEEPTADTTTVDETIQYAGCNDEACNRDCSDRGGGDCGIYRMRRVCFCRRNIFGAPPQADTPLHSDCNQEQCNQSCKNDGRGGGSCGRMPRMGDVCFCDKARFPGK